MPHFLFAKNLKVAFGKQLVDFRHFRGRKPSLGRPGIFHDAAAATGNDARGRQRGSAPGVSRMKLVNAQIVSVGKGKMRIARD